MDNTCLFHSVFLFLKMTQQVACLVSFSRFIVRARWTQQGASKLGVGVIRWGGVQVAPTGGHRN